VFPNYSDLELFDARGVWEHFVSDELNHYTSAAFEDVCTQWMQRQNIANALPFRCEEIKRWWSANAEIDIVGLSRASGKSPAGAQMILAECKYRNQPVGLDVLTDLQDKSQVFNARKKHYYLFSKSGFTVDLEKYVASTNDVVLVGLDDLFELDQS
jgi:AAA+ ATPase superfamily predicted ATPase